MKNIENKKNDLKINFFDLLSKIRISHIALFSTSIIPLSLCSERNCNSTLSSKYLNKSSLFICNSSLIDNSTFKETTAKFEYPKNTSKNFGFTDDKNISKSSLSNKNEIYILFGVSFGAPFLCVLGIVGFAYRHAKKQNEKHKKQEDLNDDNDEKKSCLNFIDLFNFCGRRDQNFDEDKKKENQQIEATDTVVDASTFVLLSSNTGNQLKEDEESEKKSPLPSPKTTTISISLRPNELFVL